jgi:hypothetical protein
MQAPRGRGRGGSAYQLASARGTGVLGASEGDDERNAHRDPQRQPHQEPHPAPPLNAPPLADKPARIRGAAGRRRRQSGEAPELASRGVGRATAGRAEQGLRWIDEWRRGVAASAAAFVRPGLDEL